MSNAIDRLTHDLGYPLLDAASYNDFISAKGERVVFLTGDPAKNLETNDVAAILPELVQAFQQRFKPAVVDRALEQSLRERYDVWPTPSLLFLRDGALIGAVPKVRDWPDYLSEIKSILDRPQPATAQ